MNRIGMAGVVLLVMVAAGGRTASGLPSTEPDTSDEQAKGLFAEGLQRQQEKRFPEAIQAYERALRYDPNQSTTLNNLGFCYKSMGKYHKAVTYYRQALSIDPQLAEAYEYLGEAYLSMGKIDLAKLQYRKLLKLNSEEAAELKEKIDEQETAAP